MSSLLKFETGLQMRGVGFWIAVVIMFALGLLTTSTDWLSVTGDTGEKFKADSPFMLMLLAQLAGLAAIFFAGVFVVNGMMRDQTHNSLEIVHSTPVTTPLMQGTRLAGAVLATIIATGAILVGGVSGIFMPWTDSATLGAGTVAGFLHAFVFGIVLNAVLLSAIFALVGGLSRSRMGVYVAAVIAFLLYLAAGSLSSDDIPKVIRALVDPLGGSAMALDTRFWSADEQNILLPPLSGWFGFNRLVYGVGGFALLGAAFLLFKRGIGVRRPGLLSRLRPARADDDIGVVDRIRPVATRSPGLPAFLTRFSYEYTQTVRSIPFIVLALVMVGFSALILWIGLSDIVASRVLPTNGNVAELTFGGAALPLLIILIFFSGDIIWRERAAGISELVDSTRVANFPLMAAKWLAMVAVIATLLLALAVMGMVAQVLLGDIAINPGTHLASAFSPLPSMVIYAAFVMFIQNFMPNRITGLIVGAVALIVLVVGLPFLPIYHPLMDFGSISLGGFSEMAGFSNLVGARWSAVYWGGLATVFAVVSMWLWRRGTQVRLGERLSGLRERAGLPSALALGLGVVAFLAGGYRIADAHSDSNYRTALENEKLIVAYEQRFGDRFDAPLPKIRDVDADVTFRPSRGTAVVSGTYELENVSGAPLDELFITFDEDDLKDDALQLDIDGARIEDDEQMRDFGVKRAVFEPPIPEGAIFDIGFTVDIAPPKLANGSPIDLNGTFVRNSRLFPGIGLTAARMTNPDKRRKYDLPELPLRPDQDDMEARQVNFFSRSADRVGFATRFCTEAGQVPVAPGEMRREYEATDTDGTPLICREFVAAQPITNFFAFTSGRYEVATDTYVRPDGSEVALSIHYDAQHDYNIELMLDAMQQGLTTMEREFGPYQHTYARIIEFPRGGFAQSFPGTIPFSENLGFVRDPGDKDDDTTLDYATYITQHELGHQWFGHQIVPADVKGFNILSESLTEHAAMIAYIDSYSWDRARLMHTRRNVNDYLQQRTMDSDAEPALQDAEGQSYLFYAKGAWVMWGLMHMIGEDEVNAALRDLLAEYDEARPPYPTTHNLVSALRARAGDEYQDLITDYFERITFWDLSLEGEPAVDGRSATLKLATDKRIADSETGKETSVSELDDEALNEWVEVAVYDKDPDADGFGDWLSLDRLRVTEAEQDVTLTLPDGATHIVLDPRRLLIERDYTDNVIALPVAEDSDS